MGRPTRPRPAPLRQLDRARALSEAEIIAKFWDDPGRDAAPVRSRQSDGASPRRPPPRRRQARAGRAAPPHGLRRGRRARADRTRSPNSRAPRRVRGLPPSDVLPALPTDALPACGTLAWVEQPAYGRGFDTDDARKVTKVEPGSGAEKAGIRAGMIVHAAVSPSPIWTRASPMSPSSPTAAATRTITWLPDLAEDRPLPEADPHRHRHPRLPRGDCRIAHPMSPFVSSRDRACREPVSRKLVTG